MDNQRPSDQKGKQRGRKGAAVPSEMIYGKVPPQAKDLECAVLGAIMIEKNAFDRAMEVLQPECFYLDGHQRIYRAFQNLYRRNQPIDILTTVEELKTTGDLDTVGGPYYVTKLTNDVTSSANLPTHARIIYQKYVRREMIRIGSEMVADGFRDDLDVFDTMDMAERKISSLAIAGTIKAYQSLKDVAAQAIKDIYQAQQTKAEITGVPSGIRKLDLLTQGWQPTNLIVLAARPGIGKSALAGNLAYNAATHPEKPTGAGIFSLEMGATQWVIRMLSAATQIPMYDLKRGYITDEQMAMVNNAGMIKFPDINIFFDDTPALDIYQLKSKARMMVLKEKVGLIIVDYLQLMSGNRSGGETREQEVSRISRELKQLAKELQVPVIALSQLSRAGDTNEPQLRNLRESGAIEQDADDVLFLTEPDESEINEDATLRESLLIKIAKHRNGTLDRIAVKFVKGIQKIMSEGEYERYKSGSISPGAGWKPATQASLYPPTAAPPKDPSEEMPF